MQWLLFALCTWLCVFASNSIEPKTLSLPLVRRRSPRQMMILQAHRDGLHDSVKNDTIALYRYLDSEFYAKAVVGKPGKSFNMILDTTWSESWLLSSDCSSYGCALHNKYDHTRSSTYIPDNRIFFMNQVTYNLTGYYSFDTFNIGHLRVNQTFIEMTKVDNNFFYGKGDGVMALGLKYGNNTPFFYKLLEYGNITNPIFSIYINRDPSSKHGGQVNLGFVEKNHIHQTNGKYDEITYVPIVNDAVWEFKIDKILVVKGQDKIQFCVNGCGAWVDSSNNIITGPKEDIINITKLLKAHEMFYFGRYRVNCDEVPTLPAIHFILNGVPFVLKSRNYVQKMSVGPFTFCLLSFAYSEAPSAQNVWLIGGAFLSEFYSIYDIHNRRIGFVMAA